MPWYKAGTVSVVQNSNAVVGTGTAFIVNARVGDAFRGPDGGWYEVTNIASDTALSISPNYQGVNNNAGVYALAPMQGYVKQSADALRALVNQFGGVLAVLGVDPTLAGVRSALNLNDTGGLIEGTNKYYTDSRVRGALLTGLVTTDASAVAATDALLAALGKLQAQASAKAAKGANSDITSLSALSTALSVAQGGTGVGSMSALLTALNAIGNFSRGNSVGTVSQSGGIPTGAIAERGSNANGEFVKLIDGTMICWAIKSSQVTGFVAVGNVFYGGAFGPYQFPATFVGSVVCRCLVPSNGVYVWSTDGNGFASTTQTQLFYMMAAVNATITIFPTFFAIGRWF